MISSVTGGDHCSGLLPWEHRASPTPSTPLAQGAAPPAAAPLAQAPTGGDGQSHCDPPNHPTEPSEITAPSIPGAFCIQGVGVAMCLDAPGPFFNAAGPGECQRDYRGAATTSSPAAWNTGTTRRSRSTRTKEPHTPPQERSGPGHKNPAQGAVEPREFLWCERAVFSAGAIRLACGHNGCQTSVSRAIKRGQRS